MMLPLYPPITPYSSGFLKVDSVHELYWEQLGNPDGIPVVFLHGGPGGGAGVQHRQLFDPNAYRIIIFDQRGAGRSHPLGSVEANTPDLLVADLEALRVHLRVEKWHLFGGSWGSTLALLYALAYPERCSGMVLHSVFLMRAEDIAWFTDGVRVLQPEAHRIWRTQFEGSGDILAAYEARLQDGALADQVAAARDWYAYESALARAPGAISYDHDAPLDAKLVWALARIECHYFRHYALDILPRVGAIAHIPLIIVQGRYDLLCPMSGADALHRAWPNSELIVVNDAGHTTQHRGMCKTLIEANDRMRHTRG